MTPGKAHGYGNMKGQDLKCLLSPSFVKHTGHLAGLDQACQERYCYNSVSWQLMKFQNPLSGVCDLYTWHNLSMKDTTRNILSKISHDYHLHYVPRNSFGAKLRADIFTGPSRAMFYACSRQP